MVTVHVILNAHLDPIWLWPWQAGLDSAIATCRSACDRLDAHPDIHFTRGEAWVYRQIERVDPQLFGRIREHVKAGRWEIVGGWWIQPDCNLPSGFAMREQIEIGRRYFEDRFGYFPRVGYNVDSFGHAATLPTIMRAAGQDRYVMMRPQRHEMELPARVFRWRETADKPEVITFRIASSYNHWQPTAESIADAASDLPSGIEHTMCYMGIGDHGGGPTERIIAWCRENRDAVPGCRLEFSTVTKFFDAISSQSSRLPVVTGELQMHAVGCYSVHRPIKIGERKAEHLMRQAEVALASDPMPEADSKARMEEAWRQVCFHHFHDTYGGTCIPSAYPQVDAQLGLARAVADELTQLSVRRQMVPLADDARQRMVLFNASDAAFDDYVEVEPWLEWIRWQPNWVVRDEAGEIVPAQQMQSEAATNGMTRLLMRIAAKPAEMRILRIDKRPADVAGDYPARVIATVDSIASASGIAVHLDASRQMRFGTRSLALPRLDLIEDNTDTWSHGVDRYPEAALESATWDSLIAADTGPLMASLIQHGRIGSSRVTAEYRVYSHMPHVQVLLRLQWSERRKMLKLVVDFPSPAIRRIDGIMGGEIERPLIGRECPLRDRTLVELQDGNRLGVICPEVFAMDATPRRLRLTLLRSPIMAHHDPHPGQTGREVFADQGEHVMRLRFVYGREITGKMLDAAALTMHRPLIYADLTRGMPPKDEAV